MILGLMVGGGLALVGSVFQVVLRNPLATPYTLGVTGGAAVGAALVGTRPIVEILFGDFTTLALDQLINQAAKYEFSETGAQPTS